MSTKKNPKVSLPSLTNADDSTNSQSGSELIKTHKIPGSPFTILEQEQENSTDKEFHLLLGPYKVMRESFATKDEIYQYLDEHMWDTVLAVACIAITSTQNQNEKA